MKLKIITQTGQSKNQQELPEQFNEPVNPTLIKRAVAVIQSNKRQKFMVYRSEQNKQFFLS